MKRAVLTLVFCILSSLSFASEGIFSVHNIGMDITDTSSVKAKNKAARGSQKIAFETLVKRLSMLNDNEVLSLGVTNKEMNSIVSDFYISEEKSSDVRYTGLFHFNFHPKKTAKFFKSKNISFTSIKSGPVLIIPIWRKPKESLLWEDNNIWWQAWEKFPNDSFLVPTKLPFGDLTDLSQISVSSVIEGELKDIKSILARYNVKDIVITTAYKTSNGLMVEIDRYGLNEVSSKSSIFVEGKEKTYGQVLSEAVEKVNNELSTLWKENTLTKPEEISYIDASIKISNLENLNEIKEVFQNITIIEEFKENVISIEEVVFDVYYQGSFFDLKLALSQHGIEAEKTDTYSCNLSQED